VEEIDCTTKEEETHNSIVAFLDKKKKDKPDDGKNFTLTKRFLKKTE